MDAVERKRKQIDVRREKMQYIEAMDDVKNLELIPVFDVASRQMVADYFGVTLSALTNFCNNHSDELAEYGTIKLYVKDFLNAGFTEEKAESNGFKNMVYESYKIRVGNNGLCCLSKQAVFNIALSLKGSSVAENILNKIDGKDVAIEQTSELEIVEDNMQDNQLQIFSNEKFGDIRMLVINCVPWFVGKDVAEILGYAKARNAIAAHVDDEDKKDAPIQGVLGGKQNVTIINESGLYSLVLSSKLPSAKEFKRWVTSEVLPSIRKHGAYMTPQTLQKALQDPDTIIMIMQNLKAEQQKNRELQIKVDDLSTTNKALADGISQWESKSIINALMRSYAVNRFNGQFQFAFADFYKQLKYKYHIDLKIRKSRSNGNGNMIDFIREDEMEDAVRLAVAICEENGINAGNVINCVNLEKCVDV